MSTSRSLKEDRGPAIWGHEEIRHFDNARRYALVIEYASACTPATSNFEIDIVNHSRHPGGFPHAAQRPFGPT